MKINSFRLVALALAISITPTETNGQNLEERIIENHYAYVPAQEGDFPALIVIPGCSGISTEDAKFENNSPDLQEDDLLFRRHYRSMATRLSAEGYAVYLIDVHRAEGVLTACAGEISNKRLADYVSAAILWVAGQPDVDAKNISLIGWSMGGGGVLEWLQDPSDGENVLKSAVVVYPGDCDEVKDLTVRVPILMLLGGADDVAEPGACEDLVADAAVRDQIDLRTYADARHGFDIRGAPAVVEIGGDKTIGYQPAAAESSWNEIIAFLGLNNTSLADNGSYTVVHGWPSLPNGVALGRASGVAVDSHNHVFVFHSAERDWSDPFPDEAIAAATVVIFDGATGDFLGKWGENLFVMPHGLTVDSEDNVWLTDVGRHQVFKFTHDGELLLELGENRVPGTDSKHFNLPTDIAVLDDGGFFVSDGYGNARVLRFSPDGEFEFQWGERGTGEGDFDLPHGLAVDGAGRVFVADRSNSRIQIFDREGSFIAEWTRDKVGRPYGVATDAAGRIFVVDGGDQPSSPPDRSQVIRLSSTGKAEATFGRFGNYDGQFQMGHDLAVGRDGAVYVVDIIGERVQKFVAD